MIEEEEVGEQGISHGWISLESAEFLRRLGFEEEQLAEAGVLGVLKTLLEALGVEERMEDVAVVERGVDLPTKFFSVATMDGYSRPDVSPMANGFQDSISNWGVIEGEPRAEDEAEAPDSDEAERTGG